MVSVVQDLDQSNSIFIPGAALTVSTVPVSTIITDGIWWHRCRLMSRHEWQIKRLLSLTWCEVGCRPPAVVYWCRCCVCASTKSRHTWTATHLFIVPEFHVHLVTHNWSVIIKNGNVQQCCNAAVSVNHQVPHPGRPWGFWHLKISSVKVSTLICTILCQNPLFFPNPWCA